MPDRAVVAQMCPNCESLQQAGMGFPTWNCKTCEGTGYLDDASSMPDRTVADDDDDACCLQHGWDLEPQTPWQTWGEGWEKVYG